MMRGRRFQFRPVLTIFAAIGLAVLIGLGNWQLQRLHWKRELIAKVDARIHSDPIAIDEAIARAEAGEDMEYTPVFVSGVPQVEDDARVFGAIDGVAGAFHFVPILRDDAIEIYVNLGFAPQTVEVSLVAIEGEGEFRGLFRTAEKPSPPASWFQPIGQTADGLWYIRDPSAFAQAAALQASPYYVDAFADPAREWPRGGTTRLDFRNKHMEYALTWFGLAAVLFVIWLIFSLPKENTSNNFKK